MSYPATLYPVSPFTPNATGVFLNSTLPHTAFTSAQTIPPWRYPSPARRTLQTAQTVPPASFINTTDYFNANRPLKALNEDAEIEDSLLDPKQHLSTVQIFKYVGGGMLLGMLGREAFRKKANVPFEPDVILGDNNTADKKLQIWPTFSDPISVMLRLVQADPKQSFSLLLYAAICVMGYLGSSVVDGSKETWVRREETKIRAHLIDRLQGIVRKSIRSKNTTNNVMYEKCKTWVTKLLQQHRLSPEAYLGNYPTSNQELNTNRLFFSQPTHRIGSPTAFGRDDRGRISPSLQARQLVFSPSLSQQAATQDANAISKNPKSQALSLVQYQKLILFGVGTLGGFVLSNFIRLLHSASEEKENAQKAAKKNTESKQKDKKKNVEVYEGVRPSDAESWAMLALKNKTNLLISSGFFSITAAASIFAKLVDAVREVEVTRVNAKTELEYQAHNWLAQDPAFHDIAISEGVRNELLQLERDMPLLTHDPAALRQRIQTLLNNVRQGLYAAPGYITMTPLVNLVDARA